MGFLGDIYRDALPRKLPPGPADTGVAVDGGVDSIDPGAEVESGDMASVVEGEAGAVTPTLSLAQPIGHASAPVDNLTPSNLQRKAVTGPLTPQIAWRDPAMPTPPATRYAVDGGYSAVPLAPVAEPSRFASAATPWVSDTAAATPQREAGAMAVEAEAAAPNAVAATPVWHDEVDPGLVGELLSTVSPLTGAVAPSVEAVASRTSARDLSAVHDPTALTTSDTTPVMSPPVSPSMTGVAPPAAPAAAAGITVAEVAPDVATPTSVAAVASEDAATPIGTSSLPSRSGAVEPPFKSPPVSRSVDNARTQSEASLIATPPDSAPTQADVRVTPGNQAVSTHVNGPQGSTTAATHAISGPAQATGTRDGVTPSRGRVPGTARLSTPAASSQPPLPEEKTAATVSAAGTTEADHSVPRAGPAPTPLLSSATLPERHPMPEVPSSVAETLSSESRAGTVHARTGEREISSLAGRSAEVPVKVLPIASPVGGEPTRTALEIFSAGGVASGAAAQRMGQVNATSSVWPSTVVPPTAVRQHHSEVTGPTRSSLAAPVPQDGPRPVSPRLLAAAPITPAQSSLGAVQSAPVHATVTGTEMSATAPVTAGAAPLPTSFMALGYPARPGYEGERGAAPQRGGVHIGQVEVTVIATDPPAPPSTTRRGATTVGISLASRHFLRRF